MYVSLYGDITDEQILYKIRRLTGDDSIPSREVNLYVKKSAFIVTGND